jgi:hypothetical protein
MQYRVRQKTIAYTSGWRQPRILAPKAYALFVKPFDRTKGRSSARGLSLPCGRRPEVRAGSGNDPRSSITPHRFSAGKEGCSRPQQSREKCGGFRCLEARHPHSEGYARAGGFRDRLLMVLLSDARHVVVASSNALVSGAARDFHDQRNGAGRNECRFPAVARLTSSWPESSMSHARVKCRELPELYEL